MAITNIQIFESRKGTSSLRTRRANPNSRVHNKQSCLKLAVLRLVIGAGSLYPIGCTKSNQVIQDPALTESDQKVLEQVRTFAADEGRIGHEAWISLTSYSRDKLLSALQRLFQSRQVEEIDKCFVAFTLCNLEIAYRENLEFIVANFNNSLSYAGSLERIISRLIDKGESDLLVQLFEVSVKADGDLSEGLADTFSKQIQTEPERFLGLLKDQPIQIRQRVYQFVVLGTSDEERIRSYLTSVPKESHLWKVAHEMLVAMLKSGRSGPSPQVR
jgi:hypothetical protein